MKYDQMSVTNETLTQKLRYNIIIFFVEFHTLPVVYNITG